METLFLQIPIHMCGPCVVLCKDVEIFIVPTICESCVVVCEDFDFYKVPLCEKFEILYWRDSVFHTYRDFPLVLERLFFQIFTLWWSRKAVKQKYFLKLLE